MKPGYGEQNADGKKINTHTHTHMCRVLADEHTSQPEQKKLYLRGTFPSMLLVLNG